MERKQISVYYIAEFIIVESRRQVRFFYLLRFWILCIGSSSLSAAQIYCSTEVLLERREEKIYGMYLDGLDANLDSAKKHGRSRPANFSNRRTGFLYVLK
jgi:hypothetical protein